MVINLKTLQMKFLKYLLLLVLVLVIGGLVYAMMQPSEYDISRNRVIKAPVADVFNTVNDLKTWEEWGPWHDEDSTIVVTYGEKTVGVGASDSWTSKDGPGNMKTVKVIPNERIEQKMQMGDFNPIDVIWTFKEVEGGTEISWSMKETDAPFMFKVFAAMSGGWDAMLGPMEAQGLENLEKVVQERIKMSQNSFSVGEVKSVELKSQKFIGYYHTGRTDMSHEEMTKLFMTSLPKAGMYAVKSGLKEGDYTPGSVYTKWDEETKEAEFYIGLLLHKNLKPGEGMKVVTMPSGKGVMVDKYGNYGIGDMEAHAKIDQYMKANKLEYNGLVWELYMNDPTSVKPKDIQTDIYYAVK